MEGIKQQTWLTGIYSVLLVAGCFLTGGVFGCLFAAFASGESVEELGRYLADYLALIEADRVTWSAVSVIWNHGRWLLGCIIFGLSGLGVIVLPVLFGMRGFLLAFGVSCFVRIFGGTGLIPATILFGIPAVLWLPALFLTGSHCLKGSARALRRSAGDRNILPGNSRSYRICVAVSIFLFVLCVILECSLLPALLPSAVRILG